MRGCTLGGAADDPAHRHDEQTASDQNDKDEKNVAPGQFSQETQMVTGFIHDIVPPNLTVSRTMIPKCVIRQFMFFHCNSAK